MFRGRFEHAIDGKGRTSLPSRFREELASRGDSRLVITAGFDPCLEAWPMSEWLAFEERVAQQPEFDPAIVALRRIYFSGAVECDLDKLGRVLVPAHLRKHARLEREVMWAGMGKKLELWDRPAFDELRGGMLEDPDQRAALIARLTELRV